MTDVWYIVQSKIRQEIIGKQNLLNQGYNVFLPEVCVAPPRKRKSPVMHEPMFPGYLMISLDIKNQNTAPIRSTKGVVGLVGFCGNPSPLPGEVALSIFSLHEQHKRKEPIFTLKKGENVEITEGPMTGVNAMFQSVVGTDRVLLLLHILGRESLATAPIDAIARI